MKCIAKSTSPGQYYSIFTWLSINSGLCSHSRILMRALLHFPPKHAMTSAHPHTFASPTSLQNPAIQWNPQTSFCSQTKSLKANRCFLVMTASYHSYLSLIRLYFLTQMLRSSIYQMHQKSGQGGGGMSEHRKYPRAREMRRNMPFFYVGPMLFLKRR